MPDIRNLGDREIRTILDMIRKQLAVFGYPSPDVTTKRFMSSDHLRLEITIRGEVADEDKKSESILKRIFGA